MTTATIPGPTNFDFAELVGVHHTMASRLRNGERSPSIKTFWNVVQAYSLTDDQMREWLSAIAAGDYHSGEWLRANVFCDRPTAISEDG